MSANAINVIGKTKVIFDDDCMICSEFVLNILKQDTSDQIVFIAPLSKMGQEFIKQNNWQTLYKKTIIVIDAANQIHLRSRAIHLLNAQTNVYPLLRWIMPLLPYALMDWCYDAFALIRRKIPVQQATTCEIPAQHPFLHRIIYK